MKEKILIISLLTLSFIMHSCSPSNDEVYSCNPNADAWVKEHLKDIKSMDREEWLKIDNQSYKKAAYTAFTPIQKQTFWMKKLKETLELSWNNEEKEHLSKLLSFIENKTTIFETGMTDEDEIWSYKWQKYGEEVLKWDQNILFNITMNGDKIMDTKATVIHQDGTHRLKTRSEHGDIGSGYDPTCDCRADKNDCESGLECRKASVHYCNMTYCGFLYLHVCNGKCKKIQI